MKNTLRLSISLIALGLSTTSLAIASEQADSITSAIIGGKTSLALRYRYEYVDADNGTREANASTLRTRLTYNSLAYQHLSGHLQMDNLSKVYSGAYNDGSGGEEAVVKDPIYTEINEAYIDYAAPENTLLRYGRQRVNLDNQRFIGGVGWRQNEQTYDAFAIVNSSLPDTTILLANVYNVNTITGGNINGNNHQLYNISNTSIKGLKLTGYFYALKDISDTYGLRTTGKHALNQDITLLYTAEFAKQQTNNAAKNDTHYTNLEAGLAVSGVTTKLSYELQSSDKGVASFKTPLGTNHGFNGWADMFLSTPASGLEDKFITISSKLLGPKISIAYHQFDSDIGSINFGSEFDLAVNKKFTENYSGLFKVANFSEGDVSGGKKDTAKVWLQLVAKF